MNLALKGLPIYSILLILLFAACEEEEEQSPNNASNTEYVFTVGVDRGVNITKFNTPIDIRDEDGFISSYVLDLNQDQMDDIIISSEEKRMGENLDYQSASIQGIHNDTIEFATTFYADSVYKCLKKVKDSLVDEYRYYKSKCSCTSTLNDTTYEIGLGSISKFYTPNAYNRSQSFQASSWYFQQDFILAYNQSKRYNAATNSVTLCYTQEEWNNAIEQYVVFRIKKGSETKLGWIKLSISNYYQILLHEYAIEK